MSATKGGDFLNNIITIGRQFGSGGREFGRRLAEELGYEYYDKEIITELANRTELSEEYLRNVIERRPHMLYPITVGHTMSAADSYYLRRQQSIFSAQSELLKELAQKSNCVIVGRCAGHILKDFSPYRVFVYASIESRVKRCMERSSSTEGYSEKEIRKSIIEIDKHRAKYHYYHTGERWGDKNNYDLCINTTDLVIKDVVPYIAKIFI